MTATHLQNNFHSIFHYFLLFNKDGKTFIGATEKIPQDGECCLAYLPFPDPGQKPDFVKISGKQISGKIRQYKAKKGAQNGY